MGVMALGGGLVLREGKSDVGMGGGRLGNASIFSTVALPQHPAMHLNQGTGGLVRLKRTETDTLPGAM